MADFPQDIKVVFDFSVDKFFIVDNTDYSGHKRLTRIIREIKAPSGNVVYSNYSSTDDFPSVGSGNKSITDINIPKTSDGNYEEGIYTFHTVADGQDNITSDFITFENIITYDFSGYEKLEIEINQEVFCGSMEVDPSFKSTDITDYNQGGVSYTLNRTHTLGYPDNILTDTVTSNKVIEVSQFYTSTQKTTIESKVTYTPEVGIEYYEEIEGSKEKQVTCPVNLCQVHDILEAINKKYLSVKGTSSNTEARILKKWARAVGLAIQIRESAHYGDSESINDDMQELYDIYNSIDCTVNVEIPPQLVTPAFSTENNTITIAYSELVDGTGFSFTKNPDSEYVGFFTHNISYTPIMSDYYGSWFSVAATSSGGSDENYTTPEKQKLGGIKDNAQVNTVFSVNGSQGNILIGKNSIGLPNVTNDKQATKSEFDDFVNSKGQPNAFPGLDNNGVVHSWQLPASSGGTAPTITTVDLNDPTFWNPSTKTLTLPSDTDVVEFDSASTNLNISSITTASPAVVTIQGTFPNAFENGQTIDFNGILGSDSFTDLNSGNYIAKNINRVNNTFEIYESDGTTPYDTLVQEFQVQGLVTNMYQSGIYMAVQYQDIGGINVGDKVFITGATFLPDIYDEFLEREELVVHFAGSGYIELTRPDGLGFDMSSPYDYGDYQSDGEIKTYPEHATGGTQEVELIGGVVNNIDKITGLPNGKEIIAKAAKDNEITFNPVPKATATTDEIIGTTQTIVGADKGSDIIKLFKDGDVNLIYGKETF